MHKLVDLGHLSVFDWCQLYGLIVLSIRMLLLLNHGEANSGKILVFLHYAQEEEVLFQIQQVSDKSCRLSKILDSLVCLTAWPLNFDQRCAKKNIFH